jgi:hypothetical protein
MTFSTRSGRLAIVSALARLCHRDGDRARRSRVGGRQPIELHHLVGEASLLAIDLGQFLARGDQGRVRQNRALECRRGANQVLCVAQDHAKQVVRFVESGVEGDGAAQRG